MWYLVLSEDRLIAANLHRALFVGKPPEIVFYANDTPDTLRVSSKVCLRIEITLQLTVLLVRLRYDSKN